MISERALPFLALLSLGVVAYQQIKGGNYPPPAAPFIGVALVFTLLALLSLASPPLASALGLAVVIWLVFAYHGALSPANSGGAS